MSNRIQSTSKLSSMTKHTSITRTRSQSHLGFGQSITLCEHLKTEFNTSIDHGLFCAIFNSLRFNAPIISNYDIQRCFSDYTIYSPTSHRNVKKKSVLVVNWLMAVNSKFIGIVFKVQKMHLFALQDKMILLFCVHQTNVRINILEHNTTTQLQCIPCNWTYTNAYCYSQNSLTPKSYFLVIFMLHLQEVIF